jgi:cysteate synthase
VKDFKPTVYKLQSLCCDTIFEDTDWELNCPHNEKPALVRAIYNKKQIEVNNNLPGLYKFADWLPINRILEGSGVPITYKSEGLAKKLGLQNLFITFNGYWPEKGAQMQTGTFKECEAYSVCARKNQRHDKVMVVASAGNTSRAFAKVCSENKIPLLLCVPEDNLSSMWFETEPDSCVKLVATASGSDYFDAIHLSNIAAEMDIFYPEGGAKNVARRDGMGLTVVSAVTTIGRIPDYYFQAVGSGTGAIAAWEANLRFLEDGRFGNAKMKLMVSQNDPFLPIKDAWEAKSRNLLPFDDNDARKQVEIVNAKVLTNRRPPYSLTGGLYDALCDTNGEVLSATNEEAENAARVFLETEGNDVTSAAAVAVASLIEAVKKGKVEKDATIMLNITGGGIEKFKSEHKLHYLKPSIIFPIDPDPEDVKTKLAELFEK